MSASQIGGTQSAWHREVRCRNARCCTSKMARPYPWHVQPSVQNLGQACEAPDKPFQSAVVVRASKRLTCAACYVPVLVAVGIPRLFNSAAMPRPRRGAGGPQRFNGAGQPAWRARPATTARPVAPASSVSLWGAAVAAELDAACLGRGPAASSDINLASWPANLAVKGPCDQRWVNDPRF
jgi:hypothetical protein